MTATEQMAAVLNELMGTRRNADIGTNISARFDVCFIYFYIHTIIFFFYRIPRFVSIS